MLYPHVKQEIRGDQAHDILIALARIDEALADLAVRSWPSIEAAASLADRPAGALPRPRFRARATGAQTAERVKEKTGDFGEPISPSCCDHTSL